MKTGTSLAAALRAAFALLTFLAATPAPAAIHTLQFTTGTTNAVLDSYAVTLNSPLLNGKGTLKLIVTQYVPGSIAETGAGVLDNHPVGFRYIPGATAAAGRWQIFNEDKVTMPSGAIFNVLVSGATQTDATTLNSVGNQTSVTVAKGKPTAILLFSHMWNPVPASGNGVDAPTQALNYLNIPPPTKNPLAGKWFIYNENSQPAGAARYFVLDTASIPASTGAVKLVHTSSISNDSQYYTNIDEAAAPNWSADGIVFIAPLGVQDNLVKTVSYTPFAAVRKWTILNSSGATFVAGQTYNVVIFPHLVP